MLRQWQIECAEKAIQKFRANHQHFFCQATPGAGKTVLAATVASKLLRDDLIDLVLCFSPSLTVADGIKRTFSQTLNCTFNGGLGSIGQSLTYQSIQFLNDENFGRRYVIIECLLSLMKFITALDLTLKMQMFGGNKC